MRERQDIDVIGESPYQPRVGHVINLEWVHRYRAETPIGHIVRLSPLHLWWHLVTKTGGKYWDTNIPPGDKCEHNGNHHKSPARECIICMLSHIGQRWAGVVYLETGNIRSDKKRQIPSDQQNWNAIVTALRHILSFSENVKFKIRFEEPMPWHVDRAYHHSQTPLFLVWIKFSPTLFFTFAQQLRLQACY